MTKLEGMTKLEARMVSASQRHFGLRHLEFPSSFVIRASSFFPAFPLAFSASGGTVARESCRAPFVDHTVDRLLRSHWRGAGAIAGRPTGQSNSDRVDQHSDAGRTFRGAGKT